MLLEWRFGALRLIVVLAFAELSWLYVKEEELGGALVAVRIEGWRKARLVQTSFNRL